MRLNEIILKRTIITESSVLLVIMIINPNDKIENHLQSGNHQDFPMVLNEFVASSVQYIKEPNMHVFKLQIYHLMQDQIKRLDQHQTVALTWGSYPCLLCDNT